MQTVRSFILDTCVDGWMNRWSKQDGREKMNKDGSERIYCWEVRDQNENDQFDLLETSISGCDGPDTKQQTTDNIDSHTNIKRSFGLVPHFHLHQRIAGAPVTLDKSAIQFDALTRIAK